MAAHHSTQMRSHHPPQAPSASVLLQPPTPPPSPHPPHPPHPTPHPLGTAVLVSNQFLGSPGVQGLHQLTCGGPVSSGLGSEGCGVPGVSQCPQEPPLGVSSRPGPFPAPCSAFSCPAPILPSLRLPPLRTDVSSIGAVIYYHCKHPGPTGCAETCLEPLCWGLSANIPQPGSAFYGAKIVQNGKTFPLLSR